VLEGILSLLLDGEETPVEPGELVRVGPDVRRQLVNRGPERVLLIALGGAGEHDGRDGVAFTGWDATDGVPPQDMPMPEDLPEDERRR
jgi:mannose-6-phosphate isomerase-like protein (cupin superfamily)